MADDPIVAVEATDAKYNVLKHHPSGMPLVDGRGTWPADSFTYRLVEEGSLRIVEKAAAVDTGAEGPTRAPSTTSSERRSPRKPE